MKNYYIEFKDSLDLVIQNYYTKIAVTYMRDNESDEKFKFGDIEKFIKQSAIMLKEAGLVRGDRVAVISSHSPWAVFSGISMIYYGITVVLIDAALPQNEVEKLLEFSDVRAVFTTGEIYRKYCQKYPCFNLDNGLSVTMFEYVNEGDFNLHSTIDPEEDVAAIIFSSGTTGEMKGIKVTYESILKSRDIFVDLSGLKAYMTYLLVLPFNHIAGFTGAMTFFLTGCEIGFIENVNASKLQKGLLKFQPHYFAMVPRYMKQWNRKFGQL